MRLGRVSLDDLLRAGRPFDPRQLGEQRPAEQRRRAEAPAVDGGDDGRSGGAVCRNEVGDDFGGDVRLVAQQKDGRVRLGVSAD